MKKKLFLFTLLFCVTTANPIMGNPVDPDAAQQIASHFWMAVSGQESPGRWTDVAGQNGFHEFYLFENAEGKGFVIVAGDDRVQPILGYSLSNRISSPIPDHTSSFLRLYERQIAFHKEHSTPATSEIEQAWSSLAQGTYTPQATTSVTPLLSTTWDQSPYYNNMCPETAEGHTAAGCAAIATAQLMKYWNWPTIGNGSHSYYDNDFGYQSADFSSATYNWSLMPNALSSNSTSAQVNAIATLVYHVGVAVEMDYGIDASNALLNSFNNPSTACCENALKNYFRYKGSLHSVYRYQTSDADWIFTIKSEIDASRPVLESGFGEGGGHGFVCDGYDNNGLFHINWGWNGYMDGYYAHNALNPGQGGIGGNTGYIFNDDQALIVGIEPNGLLHSHPSKLYIDQSGGDTTFVIVPDNTVSNNWQATCDQPWLTLSPSSGSSSSGPTIVTVTTTPNTTGNLRLAEITITHDSQSNTIQVLQNSCYTENQCDVILEMSDSYGDGWNGGTITLSNNQGFVYGTVTCTNNYNYQTLTVCQSNLVVTWTPGMYDEECGFTIFREDGDTLLSVNYMPSGFYWVPEPCIPSSGPQGPFSVTVQSANNNMGSATGSGSYMQGETVELTATANSGYRFVGWNDGISLNPRYVTVTGDSYFFAYFDDLGDNVRHYDNDEPPFNIGHNGTYNWGIRFPENGLSPYNILKAVRIWDKYAGEYELRIFKGGSNAPETLVLSQTVQLTGTNNWYDVILDDQISLDHSQPLWITLYNSGIMYPAAASNYAGTPDGSWVCFDGSEWLSACTNGNNVTWKIRAVLDNVDPSTLNYTITVNSANPDMGIVDGGGVYAYGSDILISAIPFTNNIFTRWDDGNTNNPRIVTVTCNATYTAEFQAVNSIEDPDHCRLIVFSVKDRIVVEGADGLSLELYDITGRLIARDDHESQSRRVFSGIASGIYTVRANDGYTLKVQVIR